MGSMKKTEKPPIDTSGFEGKLITFGSGGVTAQLWRVKSAGTISNSKMLVEKTFSVWRQRERAEKWVKQQKEQHARKEFWNSRISEETI